MNRKTTLIIIAAVTIVATTTVLLFIAINKKDIGKQPQIDALHETKSLLAGERLSFAKNINGAIRYVDAENHTLKEFHTDDQSIIAISPDLGVEIQNVVWGDNDFVYIQGRRLTPVLDGNGEYTFLDISQLLDHDTGTWIYNLRTKEHTFISRFISRISLSNNSILYTYNDSSDSSGIYLSGPQFANRRKIHQRIYEQNSDFGLLNNDLFFIQEEINEYAPADTMIFSSSNPEGDPLIKIPDTVSIMGMVDGNIYFEKFDESTAKTKIASINIELKKEEIVFVSDGVLELHTADSDKKTLLLITLSENRYAIQLIDLNKRSVLKQKNISLSEGENISEIITVNSTLFSLDSDGVIKELL